jgi:hypothetical protein
MTTDLASESLLTEIPPMGMPSNAQMPPATTTNAQNLIKQKLKKRLRGLPSVVMPVEDKGPLQDLKRKNEELEETVRVLHLKLLESTPKSSSAVQVQVDFQDRESLEVAQSMIVQLRAERDQNGV